MDIKDIRAKSISDLHKLLVEKRASLRELVFKASEGQLKSMHSISEIKKSIAKILTVLNHAAKSGGK
ncbi:MAG: 50S ribosomal protein L29 [Candidatus Magasanikbacteria bacterium]|nr:50S ribosomal protein L29 [Candidatus Magasanikbacteria bacterium]